MNTLNKNRVLNYVVNCGLNAICHFFLDRSEEEFLSMISKKIDYPARMISGDERHSLNTIIHDAKEFIVTALVYLNNFEQILIINSCGDRVKKLYSLEDLDSYNESEKLEKLFIALGTDEFYAYGYVFNDEFYFEEVILPDELIDSSIII